MSDNTKSFQNIKIFISEFFSESPLTSDWGQQKIAQVIGEKPFKKDKKKVRKKLEEIDSLKRKSIKARRRIRKLEKSVS